MSKKWMITGANKGLGLALSKEVLGLGNSVFGIIRGADDCAAFEKLSPGRSHAIQLSVTDFEKVALQLHQTLSEVGSIDVLVNNSGYGLTGALEETEIEQIQDLFNVNVFGAIAVIKVVLPFMRQAGRGHIINITSVSGLAPWAGTSVYGASKFALECIGRTLRDEVKPLGIDVTNIAPGGMRTHFAGGSLKEASGKIADYAETAHMAREILKAHQGEEPSDIVKVAKAIIAVAEKADPPFLQVLGEDALHYATHHLQDLSAEIEKGRELGMSTAV